MARPTLLVLVPVLLSLLFLSAGRTQQVGAHAAAAAAAAAAPAPNVLLNVRGGWGEHHHQHQQQQKHAEGGGWFSWLGFGGGRAVEEAVTPTRAKKEAAKEHAKASWWWGKSYAKDKAERTAERGARRARDETAEGLEAARRKVGEQFDTVKAHAKKVAHSAQEEVKQGVDATKGAVHKVTDTVAAGKRKVDQVGDAVVVLSDAKRTYDKYQSTKAAGKAKTKNFFRRVWEFVWPPARRPVCSTATDASELVVPAEEIPAIPRSVDEALEDFEACKDEEEAARMTAAERAKTRSLFEIAKAKITGKPPLAKELGPQASFRERWEAEKVRFCLSMDGLMVG